MNQYLGLTDLSTVGANVMSSNAPVTFENLGNLAVEIGEQSVVDAAISTAIEGGSFLTALENNAVASLAAVGAGAIGGDAGITPGSFESIALHSVLGCASSAALGTGCAGGAIGGATSALVSPYLVDQAGGIANLTADQRAAIVTAATFLGGMTGAALGQNVTGATTAATNEALNNSTNKQDTTGHKTGQQNEGEKDTLSIVPPAGGAIDEENAGDAPVAGKGTAAAAAAGATNTTNAATQDAYSFYTQQAQTLNVSTAPSTAVFYSGPGNRALAEEFATTNGSTTLEMTPGGSWLDQQALFGPNSPLTPEQALNVWSTLSQRYAASASGNVVGFVQGARPTGIFNTVEYPALLNNPSVTNVITNGH